MKTELYSHIQLSCQPEIMFSTKIQIGIITIVRVSLYSVFHDYCVVWLGAETCKPLTGIKRQESLTLVES